MEGGSCDDKRHRVVSDSNSLYVKIQISDTEKTEYGRLIAQRSRFFSKKKIETEG